VADADAKGGCCEPNPHLSGFAVGGAIEDLGEVNGRRIRQRCNLFLSAEFTNEQPEVV